MGGVKLGVDQDCWQTAIYRSTDHVAELNKYDHVHHYLVGVIL